MAGEILPVLYSHHQMGIISDSFKVTLDALIERDKKSKEDLKHLLVETRSLINTLEAMDLGE
jgi:hypothetical protein